jgi:predicted Zn-dependent protease
MIPTAQQKAAWRNPAMALAMAFLVGACQTTNPATGKREFTPFMSPAQEIQVGQENHPQVVAENGGVYDDANVGGYVASVGGRLAANSELPDMEFTFTVLNTPLVNSFALPGGYIYVTRGILAIFNDEAELASVLGHEIGHVTARHTAKRYNKAMMAGILSAGAGIALGSPIVNDLISQGAQLYLLGYSRDQEYQSDELGIRYMNRAGYDPYASADMLRALQAQEAISQLTAKGEKSQRPPEFYSTHPNTENRVARAEQKAAETGVAKSARPRLNDRYLSVIDGMLYGDDPDQGLIRDNVFWHPKLKFTFTAPAGYTLMNSAQAVYAKGPQGNVVLFTLSAPATTASTDQAMREMWTKFAKDIQLGSSSSLTINGMEARTAAARANLESGPAVVRITTIRYAPTQAYHFLEITPDQLVNATSSQVQTMVKSFRKLKDNELNKYKPLRLKVVTVQKGDTVESIAKRMAFPDYQVERFRALNGLSAGDTLKAGDRVKIVVEG